MLQIPTKSQLNRGVDVLKQGLLPSFREIHANKSDLIYSLIYCFHRTSGRNASHMVYL